MAAEKRCASCGELLWAWEGPTNALLGRIARRWRWPETVPVLASALWTDLDGADRRWDRVALDSAGRGADWVLHDCEAGRILRQGEHKPDGANGQASRATAADYEAAIRQELIIPGSDWTDIDFVRHEQPHVHDRGICGAFCKRIAGSPLARLALPQVVRYRLDNGLPCTLITARPDMDSVYGAGTYWSVASKVGPVRAPAQVLNSVAAQMAELVPVQYRDAAVRELLTRIWLRISWDHDALVEDHTRHWLRPEVLRCAQRCSATGR